MAPQRYVHVLILRTCDVTLFGKRVFTDVIKVKDLEMRKLSWINWWALNAFTSVF